MTRRPTVDPDLRDALERLERVATRLSNHDRVKQPARSASDWGKLHHAIDVARDALAKAEGESA